MLRLKIFTFFFILAMAFVFTSQMSYAQDVPWGPAPRFDNPISPFVQPPSNMSPTSRAFAFDAFGGPTGPTKFFLNTPGTLTNMAPQTSFFAGGTWVAGPPGRWYYFTYSPVQFGYCDTATGANTLVGSPSVSGSPVALAWDPTTSTMYAITAAPNNLYTINVATGAATLVAAMTGPFVNCIDAAVSNGGVLYGIELTGAGNLGRINKTTAVWTTVGPTGITPYYAQGSAFDRSDNRFYWASYTQPGPGILRVIDTVTGSGSTIIGTFQNNAEMDGMCIPSAPPPTSLLPFACDSTAYNSITGTPGPTGDDATITVTIPFTFTYLGTGYTSASICTNGWVALGTTASTTYSNDLCTTTAPDLKKLCPFWDDLDQGGGGNIVYTTLGTTPNRAFIVQYTNVAYFGGTGNVTFQVVLCESNNSISYIYGPAVPNASASGSVGLNDATGGTNHFMSVTPASTCGQTNFSQTVCNNTVPYTASNFPVGRRYRFGTGDCGPVGIISGNGNIPHEYSLSQNYPNPFNPSTKISYALPKAGNVKLVVFDLLGREVAVLVNESKKAGNYDINFDASHLSSGVYFYKLQSGDFTSTKKMALIK